MSAKVPGEATLVNVRICLCSACLSGAGGECHTPGCALWLNRAPDLPVCKLLYENLDDPDWALKQREEFDSICVRAGT
ncbi:MAG TPA: hypothetical protein VET26_12385 [Candidatus Sulfotelmatobacter sp.]|nr:hypothetical protein [Candidatus Sulfotelmatobacter sp.]